MKLWIRLILLITGISIFSFASWHIVIAFFVFGVVAFAWKSDILPERKRNVATMALLLLSAFLISHENTQKFPARAGDLAAIESTLGRVNRSETGVVVGVIDGDSILVRIDNRIEEVRYIGVDAPEIIVPRKDFQCLGIEAATFNSSLVLGKTVTLTKEFSEQDRIGRLLRHVFVDGDMIQKLLLARGLAKVMSIEPDISYASAFLNLQSQAQKNHTGIWDQHCS